MDYAIAGANDAGAGADGDGSAGGHGVARIDGEIQQNLLEHGGIGHDSDWFFGQLELEAHVFGQDAAQHLREVLDEFAELGDAGMKGLLTAEGEQRAGEVRGAGDRSFDRFQALDDDRREILLELQDLRMTLDDGEHVVEVMRDGAGQAPDGIELLDLAELGLQLQAIGDVPEDALDADDVVLGIVDGRFDALDAGFAAVGQFVDFGAVRWAFGGKDAEIFGFELEDDGAREDGFVGAAENLLGGHADEAAEFGINVGESALQIFGEEGLRQVLDE